MATIKTTSNIQQAEKEFMCTYDGCLKAFTSLSHLNRHEDVHIKKEYKCKECNATFTAQFNLKRHIDNKHLKKKPKLYKCSYCEESFNKKTWLNRHISRHTGVRPYICTFENCEARFEVPSKLKRHMKIHEGYICPKENCSEKFGKWSEVRRHLKIVHPKVFKCPECELEFSRKNNLKSHTVVHNPDRHVFLCPKERCHRFYSKKYNLKHHLKEYHEKRPFNCSIGQCSRAFKSQEELDDHISRHSPSGKLKKRRKKKHKLKPSFAEKLAGLAPKKWQIDVLESASKSANAKISLASSSELSSTEDHSDTELENISETEDTPLLNIDMNSDEEQNHNDQNLAVNSDADHDCCLQNDDIQTLLNIIENRKNFENSNVTQKKYISIKA